MLSKSAQSRIEEKLSSLLLERKLPEQESAILILFFNALDNKNWGEAVELIKGINELDDLHKELAVASLFKLRPANHLDGLVSTSVQIKGWCNLVAALVEKKVDFNQSFRPFGSCHDFNSWPLYQVFSNDLPWQCFWAVIKGGADPLLMLKKENNKTVSLTFSSSDAEDTQAYQHVWGAVLNRVAMNGSYSLSDDDSKAYVNILSEIPDVKDLFWKKVKVGMSDNYPLVVPLGLSRSPPEIQSWFDLLREGDIYHHGQNIPSDCPSVAGVALKTGNSNIMLAELKAGALITPFMRSCMEGNEDLSGGYHWEEKNRHTALRLLIDYDLNQLVDDIKLKNITPKSSVKFKI